MQEEQLYTQFIVLSIFFIYFIYSYSNKEVSYFVQLITYVSLFVCFSQLLYFPQDLSLNINNLEQTSNITFSLYWTLQLLSWLIIPILQSYQQSGYLDQQKKWQSTVKKSGTYFILLISIVLGFIYVLYAWQLIDNLDIFAFLKALSNSSGIFQIIVMLSYSLVAIPKAQLKTINNDMHLKYIYFKVAQLKQDQQSSLQNLLDLLQKIVLIKNVERDNLEILDYCENVINFIPEAISTQVIQELRNAKQSSLKSSPVPEYNFEYIVELRTQIKHLLGEIKRSRNSMNLLLREAFWVQDVINSQYNLEDQQIFSSIYRPHRGWMAELRNTLQWYWYIQWKSQMKIVWIVLFYIISLIILESEVSLFYDKQYSALAYIFNMFQQYQIDVFYLHIFILALIFFMLFQSQYGLFKNKISGFYGLYSNNNTDAGSLLFICVNLTRTTVPLCYNFLDMINVKNTQINNVLGDVENIPILGKHFTLTFPAVMVVLVLLHYLNFYNRILNLIGLQVFKFSEDFNQQLIGEGFGIVREARMEEEGKIHSQPQHVEIDRSSYFIRLIDKE
ncbi:lmbr1-like conserved region family protein, putative [Ichthyophthirius multifiliis]|uniref:Lmbr1-like conserved region family protein, putative n=1 Tax=Ichthyophthirius multifiliis TaxID=5932 RepID=G0QP01_ICHMU|nr:lmbr1-like conserved region family protein, putative [Ichthyophthirius multifiliis]EGR33059.1 lmbr1-like conserved region family protein, putative [Ichthyophthirius multifiliis]|eukprot:XP_004037045.1 lmbr1-like conserved region family protein, putative [Ichthyophthirius multifiliis]